MIRARSVRLTSCGSSAVACRYSASVNGVVWSVSGVMSKGSRREREYVDLCKRAGMAVYRPATVQYGENDPFGLFDVFALSPSHSRIHAVQVKSNRASGIEAWQGHTALFRRLGMRTFYAVSVDNQGWRVIECKDALRRTVVDERDSTSTIGDEVVAWLESLQGGGDGA